MVFESKETNLKITLSKLNRLRFNGKKLHYVEDYYPIIIKLLNNKPMGATDLGYFLGKCRETVHRYLRHMLKKDMIEKIPGTGKYQKKGQGFTARYLALLISTKHEFNQCYTIQKWLRHVRKTKSGLNDVNSFRRLCMGKWTSDFKINPDTWIHPETTETCIDILLSHFGRTELSQGHRAIIRHFLKFGLGLNISTEEAKSLGIGGHKDFVGKHASISFQNGQYDKAKSYLQENYSQKDFILFGVKFWTFCRPSIVYTIKTNQLLFYDRELEYIQINGQCLVRAYFLNGKRVSVNPELDSISNDMYPITRKTQRICHIPDLFEYKTKTSYPKFIFDEEIVSKLELYVNHRHKNNFEYLFWDDNVKFTFENYTDIVEHHVALFNEILKDVFYNIGCVGELFEHRANYALRHVGVQHWLEITKYNFDLVAEMGWEDMNTLRQWYGRRTRTSFENQILQMM